MSIETRSARHVRVASLYGAKIKKINAAKQCCFLPSVWTSMLISFFITKKNATKAKQPDMSGSRCLLRRHVQNRPCVVCGLGFELVHTVHTTSVRNNTNLANIHVSVLLHIWWRRIDVCAFSNWFKQRPQNVENHCTLVQAVPAHLPVGEDEDPVRVHDGVQSVRNGENSAVFKPKILIENTNPVVLKGHLYEIFAFLHWFCQTNPPGPLTYIRWSSL